MRSSRNVAAGTKGASDRVTAMMDAAESSSFTGIVERIRLAKGNSTHCVGAIASRSEFARQVSSVRADYELCNANIGSGNPYRLKRSPISLSALGVIDVVIHSA